MSLRTGKILPPTRSRTWFFICGPPQPPEAYKARGGRTKFTTSQAAKCSRTGQAAFVNCFYGKWQRRENESGNVLKGVLD